MSTRRVIKGLKVCNVAWAHVQQVIDAAIHPPCSMEQRRGFGGPTPQRDTCPRCTTRR